MPKSDPWRPWTAAKAGRAWFHCETQARFTELAAEWAEDGVSIEAAEAEMEAMFAHDLSLIAERSSTEAPDADAIGRWPGGGE